MTSLVIASHTMSWNELSPLTVLRAKRNYLQSPSGLTYWVIASKMVKPMCLVKWRRQRMKSSSRRLHLLNLVRRLWNVP